MSELRWDPLRQRWSIIAPQRGESRDQLRPEPPTGTCPLCPGQEAQTPAEIYATRPAGGEANGAGWRTRVIPNPRPLLSVEQSFRGVQAGLYQHFNGVGAHEIIIDGPKHDRDLPDFSTEQLLLWLQTLRARLLDLRGDFRLRHFLVLRNHGFAAGARQPHPHTQILGLPFAPPELKQRLAASRDYFQHYERCLLCDLLAQELRERERIVFDDGHFVAYVPYAARAPFELTLLPRTHQHDFAAQVDGALRQLAPALRSALRRLRRALDDPPYQLLLYTAPPPHPRPGRPDYWHSLTADFHWHLSLLPQLAPADGFVTSGGHVNPVTPEEAARTLRESDGEG